MHDATPPDEIGDQQRAAMLVDACDTNSHPGRQDRGGAGPGDRATPDRDYGARPLSSGGRSRVSQDADGAFAGPGHGLWRFTASSSRPT